MAISKIKVGSTEHAIQTTVSNITDLTATATELNYMDGVTSNVQTQLDGKAASEHTHNYAGSSSAGGAATSANKVNKSLTVQLNGGTTEGTNKFTFNGSAAKSVNITPSGIGAAASSHTHDDRYYTETEIDTKLSGKANSSHGTHVSYGTTATAVGATASAGSASTVSRSDHTHSLSKSAVTTALGYTPPTTNTTYSVATTSTDGLMSSTDKAKLDATNVAYGTCATGAATAAKIVTLSGNTNWKLTNGAIIMVSFTNTNTAESVTLNVNGTGAYPIWYNASEYTGTGNTYTGYAGRVTTYMFNGTHWVWISNSYDANTQSNTNSTDTSSKIYLVGATSQGSNKTTYSHGEVYVGTDHHVYSNSKQVVNLSDTQALTNKTYNGYTLGAACAKGVDTTATSGSTNLITSGAMYTALSGKLSTTGTAAKATADASGNTITSTYMTKSNPTGTGSFSLNRKANTTVGSNSFAVGSNTTASAPYSHAEGLDTTASGNHGAHAEGYGTTASGQASHAEGLNTTASGNYSHAEGWGTIASGYSQHVQGEYNIAQAGTIYAHIVGNGTANARSNAHTLDWNGNAWYQGDVYVGGTDQNSGERLVRESSLAGCWIAFEDENGNPTTEPYIHWNEEV